jgi:hypothetical protein
MGENDSAEAGYVHPSALLSMNHGSIMYRIRRDAEYVLEIDGRMESSAGLRLLQAWEKSNINM